MLKEQEAELVSNLRDLCLAVIEQCAQVIEEIPASASLYEGAKVAKAVIAFKKRAVTEVRKLAEGETSGLSPDR